MKRLSLVCLIIVALQVVSCEKSKIHVDGDMDNPFLDSVANVLKEQLSEKEFNLIDFSNLTTINSDSGTLGLLIYMKDKSDKRYISASKSDKSFMLNRVEWTTDLSGLNGSVKTEDLSGSGTSTVDFKNGLPIKRVQVIDGRKEITYVTYTGDGKQILNSDQKGGVQSGESQGNLLPPAVVTAYVNHKSTTLYSYYYSTNNAAYMYNFTSSNNNSGGGGTTAQSLYAQYNFGGDPKYAISLSDYLKCFTNLAGSNYKYTITICVDQPAPGQRDAWGFSTPDGASGNPVNTGHVFMIFTETTPTGTTTRNVGFYPSGNALPSSPSSPGVLVNNQQHPYNVSLTITVTNSTFFSGLSHLSATQSNNYDLSSNNCTTYTLGTLNSMGINLPATQGTWPGGQGYNPGDLGEDIRNMTLSSNMTKNTTPSGNNNATNHPNVGQCAQ